MSYVESFVARGKAVVITGCSSGIGKATAVSMAEQNFTVFATVRKENDAQSLKDLNLPGLIPVWPVDMSHPAEIDTALRVVKSELKRRSIKGLYALINNAGGGKPAPVELMDAGQFRTELDARVAGSVAMIQNLLPSLREANGRIIWIMTPAIIPTPFVSSIHACDFAVNCIARTLDIELRQWGIPNIMIRCGGIKTPAGMRTVEDVETLLRNGPSDRVGLYEGILRRWADGMAGFDAKRTEPEKVARLVMRALSANRPRQRYSVGHMSKASAFLELLPQPLTDRIMKAFF